MNDDYVTKRFKYFIPKKDKDLRKVLENSNWNFQLQLIRDLQEENEQLKDNWNKLKQYLSNGVASNNYFITENCMLTKMQELEKSNSNE